MANKSTQANRGQWKKDRADRGVFQRGHVWYVRYQDQNKKMHVESVGPSKSVALKAYKKRITEISEGKFFPELVRRNVTFDEIVKDALAETQNRHRMKWGTRRRFRDYRYNTLLTWFPTRLANSITPQEIQAKLDEYKTPATFNQHRLAVSHAYKIAKQNKKVLENPATAIRLIKLNNLRVRFLNQHKPLNTNDPELCPLKDEESRLRAVIRRHAPEKEAEMDLALFTGMRWSEQFRDAQEQTGGLYWRNVDLEHKLITIPWSKSGESRTIPLNRAAIAALIKLRARFGPDEVEAAEELVCPERTEWEHRAWWNAIKTEAGVRDFRWHDLRHTFASRLVMRDVSILTVKELMGHSSVNVTLRYAHLAQHHLREAVEKLSVAAGVALVSDTTSQPRQIHQ